MVYPIFYDVHPTVVRKQTASFQEAFSKHEEAFSENKEKVQKWRDTLKQVANISGWELKDRNESEFILDIVKDISRKFPIKSEILKELVGMDSRLEELRSLMETGSNDVQMIGICGMAGMGKTTLARVVYDLISHEFQGCCFLANVREISEKGGLVLLQRQLLSQLLNIADNLICNLYDGIDMIGIRLRHKKALLVIDDVVDVRQLECLAGKREWFGSGSRIIITSRDELLLKTNGVDDVYNLKVLNYDEALQLFSMKAFKTHQPSEEYVELSESVVKYAGGLPLALKVLGSFLFGRPMEEWRSAMERLERDPDNEEVWLGPNESCQNLEVKRCGFHPVYADELEGEFNQKRSPTIYSCSTISKRRLTDYVAGEAGRSGSCDEEEPQPKRFREIK